MVRKLIVGLALAALATGAYKLTLAGPEPVAAKPKVTGRVYVLDKEFFVNLTDGHHASLTVGLDVDPDPRGARSEVGLVREVITRDLLTARRPTCACARRAALKRRLARDINAQTHVHVRDVLLSDFTVQ